MVLTKELIEEAPGTPGVYVMKGHAGKILYIGKAKSLKNRLRSYVQKEATPGKTTVLVNKVKVVEWILTGTENEALLLECNLIKQHRPPYNVLMKDDKNFPYLCVDMSHDFPKISVTRKIKRTGPSDKRKYFGPYNQIGSIHQVMRLLNKAFQIRDCTDATLATSKRPCINYDIGTCTAPCVQYVTETDYGKQVKRLMNFLRGESGVIVRELKKQMDELSRREEFEKAVIVRNQIASLETMLVHQHMISTDPNLEMDAFVIECQPKAPFQVAIGALSIRGGKVVGFRYTPHDPTFPERIKADRSSLLASYLVQYYQSNLIPAKILLPAGLLEEELQTLKTCIQESDPDAHFVVSSSKTDEENYQIEFLKKNTVEFLKDHLSESHEAKKALEEIQKKLHLSRIPHVIECVDISHFQGSFTVASVVQFVDGKPNKNGYRIYNIKTVDQVDDFASMREVIERRMRRVAEEQHAELDLLVIDGGLGQLNAARKIVEQFPGEVPEIVGLAKARSKGEEKTSERIFLPGRSNPVVLQPGTRPYSILVSLRDEAHRFAITAYRRRHSKDLNSSVLTKLKGIGQKRKELLLSHFASIEDILRASPQEICQLLQCSDEQARDWRLELSGLWESSRDDTTQEELHHLEDEGQEKEKAESPEDDSAD